MVKADKVTAAIKSHISDSDKSAESSELVMSSIALLDLVNAVVEEGIFSLSSSPSFFAGATAWLAPAAPLSPG
jgi:hypothetical protein